MLRRVNEEWGTAVLLAEHRLERCLPAADRVLALEGGRLAFDGTPEDFLRRSAETPIARLFALAGRPERPVSVKAARRALGAAPRGRGGAGRLGAAPRRRRGGDAAGRGGARPRLAGARRDDPALRRPADRRRATPSR